jgi:hypothetical protein
MTTSGVSAAVLRGEVAAVPQRNAHRLEQSRRDQTMIHVRRSGRIARRVVLGDHRSAPRASSQGIHRCRRGTHDVGLRTQLADDRANELRPRGAGRIACGWRHQFHRQEAMCVESEMLRLKPDEIPDDEACADEQYHRGREFRDHQGAQ